MYTRSLLACLAVMPLAAQVNVLTYHNDQFRTGQNLAETVLTRTNVKSATFGKLFLTSVDSTVDAQPLYAAGITVGTQGTHNVLIVATEGDTLYALDADSGAKLWQKSLLGTGESPSDTRSCSQVVPTIGITSTPVISLNGTGGGTIYTVAMSKDSSGNYHQRLHAIDLASSNETLGGPVEISATYPGHGANSSGGNVIFDPAQYKERVGLLLLNGVVYLGWASHCDINPYTGWIMGYNATTLAQTTVINVTPNGSEGAIWQAGGGLCADHAGNIYFLDANGTFDPTLNASGFPANGNFGNAFIKLSTTGGKLAVADYFTMSNTRSESGGDEDLGSGGAMLLPDMKDAAGKVRHLAVGAGKDANIYLVDRDNMGKFNRKNDNAIYQQLTGVLSGGVWSSPAYYKGRLYYGSVGDHLQAFQFKQAKLESAAASASSVSFPYPGATPSISANGKTQGIVWAVESSNTAVLHAFSSDNLATELYNSNQAANGRDHFGAGNKYMAPMIANGKVYVGTPSGVAAFGLLP